MMNWTTDQIINFAPDITTVENAKLLVSQRKWKNLAGNENFVWGECQIGGGNNYKVAIKLNGPSFSCECKSNKSPCKHIVALFLLFVNGADKFPISDDIPSWMKSWQQDKKLVKTKEELLKIKEKKTTNRSKRIVLMKQGLQELEIWLLDLIRQGFASVENLDVEFWKGIAARMVDAKLGGLARNIRGLRALPTTGLYWPEKMLEQLAQLYLVIKGFEKLEQLPETLQTELLSVAGVNFKKDDLLQYKAVHDDWMILGQVKGIEENLSFRRTWLKGIKTNRMALILEFVWGDAAYMTHWPVGKIFQGALIFYPSAFPLRVFVKDHSAVFADVTKLEGFSTLENFLQNYAQAIGRNPWLLNFPSYLEQIIPVVFEGKLVLID
ncbi:MAG TPA: SWIM zinc finger family protein, partial [Saprospiraceae bacterium]|nr:SWIM zinc finger family protein [Saprospiraceae bacterium]